jgi:hypothetical protein
MSTGCQGTLQESFETLIRDFGAGNNQLDILAMDV